MGSEWEDKIQEVLAAFVSEREIAKKYKESDPLGMYQWHKAWEHAMQFAIEVIFERTGISPKP